MNFSKKSGEDTSKSPAQNYKLALPDPAQFAGQLLKEALLRHGIQLDGKLLTVHWPRRDTFLPSQPRVLAQVLSPSINEILERGLKRSQNLYLQNLLLLAGVKAQSDIEQREGSQGFITSERGKAGGYTLSRPADRIIIGDVIDVLGGRLFAKDFCHEHSGRTQICTRSVDCSCSAPDCRGRPVRGCCVFRRRGGPWWCRGRFWGRCRGPCGSSCRRGRAGWSWS